jgi:hypothetical protein
VATSDSSLGSPDRQVFMTTNETPGPSGTVPDQYLEDISANELSADAPADETTANRDTRCEHNRKRNERRRRLRDSLPIRNLAEALDQVESRVHTTPEQCLMSVTMIARQAQGMRAGQVIAKLAEDAYFMRVNTRVAQPPPSGTATTKQQVAVRTSVVTVLELSCRPIPTVLVQRPADLLKVATALQLLAAIARSSLIATLAAEAVTAEAPTMGLTGGPVVGAIAAAEATRIDTSSEPHRAASTPARRLKNEELRRKKACTSNDNDGFPTFSARLRNLLLSEKFKPLGITKYIGASTSPSAWTTLRLHGSSPLRSTRSTSGTG